MNILTKSPETKSAGNGVQRTNTATPLANILETKEGYLLEAEMPGVNKDGLELTVDNGELVIVGHRRVAEESGTAMHRESRGLNYRRSFELDPSIDTTKITARMEQGILKLHLPKAESVKPRRIAVED